MASPPSFRISSETPFSSTDLFFPITQILLLMILISMANGSAAFSPCTSGIFSLAAEYCRVIVIKRIGLFYRICDDPSIAVFDGRYTFPISFTPF